MYARPLVLLWSAKRTPDRLFALLPTSYVPACTREYEATKHHPSVTPAARSSTHRGTAAGAQRSGMRLRSRTPLCLAKTRLLVSPVLLPCLLAPGLRRICDARLRSRLRW